MSQPPSEPVQAKGIPKPLQEASDEFYMWIGHCITDWAATESVIFQIFWKSLGCKEEQAAIVYFKSPSLETRFTLTQELVLSVLPKTESGKPIHPDLKAWNAIVSTLNDLKTVRNRIAHHPIAAYVAISDPGDILEFWFENYVSPEERLRGKHNNIKPLVVEDLKSHHLSALSLTTALKRFYERLSTYR